jgi:phenylalanyl-tRNA synthetase beta chain
MKILFSWLLDFIETDCTPQSLADALTMSGAEVNALHNLGFSSDHVVVGEILSSEKHPQADRLSVCKVSIGESNQQLQIVCGAKNYKIGDRVPVALPGAELPGGLVIKKSKIRGVTSEGMMCSAQELSLPQTEDGLLILDRSLALGTRVDSAFPADFIFEIEVTSNRSDLLSHLGIARELVGIGVAIWKKQQPHPAGLDITLKNDSLKITIEDVSFCQFYSATVFRELPLKQTPLWMRSRLQNIGVRPINFLVDVTNYLLHHIGQPMHVFDLDKLSGDTIFIRKSKDGEIISALDHNTYRLTSQDWLIADAKMPLALAGIIGGELSAVSSSTKNVLLEIARFSPSAVRTTSRKLRICTDSSYRFERGIDPKLPQFALNTAVDLIVKELGVKPSFSTQASVPQQSPYTLVPLRAKRAAKIIGLNINAREIFSRLCSLGFQTTSPLESEFSSWKVPSWRLDVQREADLIEELARTLPLEKIPSVTFLDPAPTTAHDLEYDYHNAIRRTLCGLGWHEVLIPPLTHHRGTGPKISNPMTSDHTTLRSDFLDQMISVLTRNIDAGNIGLRLFSIGKIFLSDGSEQNHLALIATGQAHDENWLEKKRSLDAFDIKAALRTLGILYFRVNYLTLAQMREYGLKNPIAYVETAIPKPTVNNQKFQPWPEFPSAKRDIAIVVKKSITAQEILSKTQAQNLNLLESAEIIDLYTDPEGRHIPSDCKTLTISCTYRAPDRTLTDTEIDSAHESVKKALLSIPTASIRA